LLQKITVKSARLHTVHRPTANMLDVCCIINYRQQLPYAMSMYLPVSWSTSEFCWTLLHCIFL